MTISPKELERMLELEKERQLVMQGLKETVESHFYLWKQVHLRRRSDFLRFLRVSRVSDEGVEVVYWDTCGNLDVQSKVALLPIQCLLDDSWATDMKEQIQREDERYGAARSEILPS